MVMGPETEMEIEVEMEVEMEMEMEMVNCMLIIKGFGVGDGL